MPRTDAVAAPGCPPIRAISFDNLGLIKVVESSGENGHAQVVARWGEPQPQKSILCVSMSSDDAVQALAVARRNNIVDILDPTNGAIYTEVNVSLNSPANANENAQIVGVHLLRAGASGARSLVTCASTGIATLHCISWENAERKVDDSVTLTWPVCKSGSIMCMKVDMTEKYAAFGGDGAEPALWEIDTQSKIWEAKAPRRDNMGLMSRPFVTSSTFLGDDHRKLIVGTGHHQIRLYDISAQRRPTISFDYLESPIKAVEADSNGYSIFVGTGNGDLATFDMRTGKLLGGFKGKCSGSVRSIAKHPTLPILATCGLDRYLRVFHTTTRQLLTRVFLKQQLVAVVFDSKHLNLSERKDDAVIEDASTDEKLHLTSTEQSRRKRKPKKSATIDGSLKRRKKRDEVSLSNDHMNGTNEEEAGQEFRHGKKVKKSSNLEHGDHNEDELHEIGNGIKTDEILQVGHEEIGGKLRDISHQKKSKKTSQEESSLGMMAEGQGAPDKEVKKKKKKKQKNESIS